MVFQAVFRFRSAKNSYSCHKCDWWWSLVNFECTYNLHGRAYALYLCASYLTFTVLVRGYKDCNTILDVSRDCNNILESSQGKELRPKMTFPDYINFGRPPFLCCKYFKNARSALYEKYILRIWRNPQEPNVDQHICIKPVRTNGLLPMIERSNRKI